MSAAAAKSNVSPAPKQGRMHEAVIVAAILLTTLSTYVGSLWYNFVYDDDGQILANSYIQYWRHVPRYFISQVWMQLFPRAGGNYYRPLFLLWLRLNDALFGLRPVGWHAAAIALHLLATLLVYLVARKLTDKISVAGITALVFGLHPIHAEVVAWVSGATESLCAVFVLAGFLAYLKSRENNAAIWMTISCVLYALAVFSKETGIVLPVLVFGHYWIYSQSADGEGPSALRRFLAAVRQVLVYAPVALFYLAARILVLHGLGHPLMKLSMRQIFFSIPSMLGFYVKKWFLPIRLNEFYDMPYWGTLNFWHVIMPAILLVALFAAIWMSRKALGTREVEFALFWVIVPILPVLDARMLPGDEMVHDRYFYLPSVGAALLVGLVIDHWTSARRGKLVFGFPAAQVMAGLALASLLAFMTIRESQFWESDYTLYTRAYELAPNSPTGRLNYGATLMTRGDFDGAQAVFTRVIAQDPTDFAPYLNMGRIAYQEHKYPEAENWMNLAIAHNKNAPDAYANLGLTELRMNRLDDALGNMRTAVQLRPNDPTFLYAYGVVLEAKGNCSMASDEFRQLLELRPGEGYAEIQLTRCQQILSHTSQN
jgi:tetratricopeptide (TPR) repeat protein